MSEDNRFPLSGVVIEIKEAKSYSQYFSKREFKIRFTDIDFKNKVAERKIKLEVQNEDIKLLDSVRIDDFIKIKFFIEGRDFPKKDEPEVTLNFTSLVCYEIEILSSESRDTNKDKDAVITNDGKVYKDPLIASTEEELAGLVTGKELEAIFDKKKDKYGLNDEPNSGAESMKSKILNKEEDPFSDLTPVKEINDLPF